VESLVGTPRDSGLKQEALAPIAEAVRKIRPKYKEFETSFTGADTRIFISQIPGGMISNLESQLKQMGCLDRIDDVLLEVPRVRKEMGYIPLVTPTSQIVGTQAVFNVLKGRYVMVPEESRNVFAGKYGATPSPVDPEIQAKVLGDQKAITCRPADELAPEYEKAKAEVGDKARSEDDIISYAIFPKVWLDYHKAILAPPAPEAPKPAPAAAPAPAPTAPATPAPAAPRATSGGGSMSATVLPAGKSYTMRLSINGKVLETHVEVLG
jgi:oxaloacetate decarboxylase alpha subunit